MACAGQWRKSALYKTITERRKTSAYGARVWLTKAQLSQKYNSPDLAEQICRAKLTDAEASKTQVKKHPDLPDSEDRACCVLGGFASELFRCNRRCIVWHGVFDGTSLQEMMLFLVWDAEGISETNDTVVEDLLKAADEDSSSDGEGKARKSKKKTKRSSSESKPKKRKRSSSSSSASESDAKAGPGDFDMFRMHARTHACMHVSCMHGATAGWGNCGS